VKSRMLGVVKTEEKKVKRLIEKLKKEKKEVEMKEELRRKGELLKYNLGKISPGNSSCELEDFTGGNIKIELDPGISIRENMERYFKKYRKLKKKERWIYRRIEEQEKKLELLRRLQEYIENSDSDMVNTAPLEFLKVSGLHLTGELIKRFEIMLSDDERKKRNVEKPSRRKYLLFYSRSGKRILVGKSAEGNDELLKSIARGNDLWFHAEAVPGSHVILQYDKQGLFSDQDIIDAANLCLYFSQLRKQKSGNIVFTHCKYVRKLKGKAPGKVIYHQNQTLFLKLDENLLNELKEISLVKNEPFK